MEVIALEILENVLLPLGICVALPVLIVWIVFRAGIIADRLRSQVLIKAIESNNNIDADKLAEAMQKPRKTPAERQQMRLMRGCLFSLLGLGALSYAVYLMSLEREDATFFITAGVCLSVGISYLVVYFIARKEEKKD